MNNEIINLVKELNNSSIISNITDEESVILDNNFMFLKGNYSKYYCVFDYKFNNINNEESIANHMLSEIENDIIGNELIKQIPANLIYSIIILKVNQINEELYKTIIKIEEDEYFSRKYVFYYNEEELNAFNSWREKCKLNSFESLLNHKENANLLENKNDSMGLKFMLRLLVKLPFVKANIESTCINDFDEELNSQINKIKNENERNSIRKISMQIFDYIDERENINKAIEDYFELCKGV